MFRHLPFTQRMNLLLLVLLSFSFLLCCDTEVYHISPEPVANKTCSDGVTPLTPCYSLQQLSNGNKLLLNKSVVVLYLLPGTHVLPANHTLTFSDIHQAEISPWNQQQEELIQCASQLFNIVLQDIRNFNISSLIFKSCTIHLNITKDFDDKQQLIVTGTCVINNCVFAESIEGYALTFFKVRTLSTVYNFSVSNSSFLSNNGAISCNNEPGSYLHTNFYVLNSLFLSNRRNGLYGNLYVKNAYLTQIHNCVFSNNIGGAFQMYFSTTLISNTSFINNSAIAGGVI